MYFLFNYDLLIIIFVFRNTVENSYFYKSCQHMLIFIPERNCTFLSDLNVNKLPWPFSPEIPTFLGRRD